MGVIKHQGKILIIERLNKEPGLTWAFPGGEIRPAETPEQACLREVLFETGVFISNVKVFFERIHPVTGRKIFYCSCEVINPAIFTGEADEIASAEWVTPQEALSRFTSSPAPEVLAHISQPLKDTPLRSIL